MSILGLTIDYGPFGFLDRFDWEHVCNGSDHNGRNQVATCKWNCAKLASSIGKAIDKTDAVDELLTILDEEFDETFRKHYNDLFRNKLGLEKAEPEDESLFEDLLQTMHETGADFTDTFINLEQLYQDVSYFVKNVCIYPLAELKESTRPQMLLISSSHRNIITNLGGYDPEFWQTERRKEERYNVIKDWSDADKAEFDLNSWTKWISRYQERVHRDGISEEKRGRLMLSANPRIVLRNSYAEMAIRAAEDGDFSLVGKLLNRVKLPYSEVKEDPQLVKDRRMEVRVT
ncbi:hypothetical protein Ciccas_007869 [Cichlidogyrus casuarinus]|uniref:Selenoprotein O n=1 Tax=Cichlidogyrus casuarinus TaxID=1844966 RepID=A0ABD2Q1M8_9PLAT